MNKIRLLILVSISAFFSCKNNTETPLKIEELFKSEINKKTECFKFLNYKGFKYTGKGGTILIFPPKAFDCGDKDTVNIKIAEFIDVASMIKANLSTESNGKLLESNGMVYCKAFKNDKELNLKKGKSFTLNKF